MADAARSTPDVTMTPQQLTARALDLRGRISPLIQGELKAAVGMAFAMLLGAVEATEPEPDIQATLDLMRPLAESECARLRRQMN